MDWIAEWLRVQLDGRPAADLKPLLAEQGVDVTAACCRNWCAGAPNGGMPSPKHMHALLDVFLSGSIRKRDKVSARYLEEKRKLKRKSEAA